MTGMSAADICILMPVHRNTSAAHLRGALDSLRHQTLRAGEILVVRDGPLTPAHDVVLDEERALAPELVVLEPGSVGLVGALNAGLAHTTAAWVARMDADDVADPRRIELQALAAREGTAGVIGSAMLEFEEDPGTATARRDMPLDHDEIVRKLRSVNPVNHPTVLMCRQDVVSAGGYLPLAGMEDYYLWARLAAAGTRFHNLPQPLVHYRVDEASYRRRADREAIRAEWHLQRHLRRLGLVGPARSATNLVLRVSFRLLPPRLMRPAYDVVRSVLAGSNRAG
ncbi:glycosyltransferase [Nocardioides euryhalodurans]|uniref:Glycosyltransferase n=1 Tax=Nocardioides euryhalodurans TaxID=2518370 RepID=A0A4P7GQ78_9ACTN|nr:glycosyltransferase [Nocardioides euryhalodurans]QBR94189.1 glycosyltransferase [Nocardioides euryhalodurans]